MVYRTDTEWERHHYTSHEEVLARGSKRVASIAEAIERATGATLDGRTALDFGCGVGRIAVPLAERCERVYGLDLSTAILEQVRANAERMHVTNLETMQSGRLEELAGRYDLVISLNVLQHIRAREGEQIFKQLIDGLAPGGVGFINVILRPPRPLLRTIRHVWRSPEKWRPRRRSHRLNPLDLLGVLDFSYAYSMLRSYSLNRLGRLLADGGVTRWQVQYNRKTERYGYDAVALVFAKGE